MSPFAPNQKLPRPSHSNLTHLHLSKRQCLVGSRSSRRRTCSPTSRSSCPLPASWFRCGVGTSKKVHTERGRFIGWCRERSLSNILSHSVTWCIFLMLFKGYFRTARCSGHRYWVLGYLGRWGVFLAEAWVAGCCCWLVPALQQRLWEYYILLKNKNILLWVPYLKV